MLYKYINENRIEPVARNGFIEVDGKRVGISNLPGYLEGHPGDAAVNNYYEFVEVTPPEYDPETQYLSFTYGVIDGEIHTKWCVNTIEVPVEVMEEVENNEENTVENTVETV